jgi:hypothetical protein
LKQKKYQKNDKIKILQDGDKKKKKVSPKFEKCGNKYLLNFFVLLERAKMAWTNG